MSDNLKTDKYVYLVTVYTGLSRNSGTKSNISFVIAGQLKDTGIRRLTNGDDKVTVFENNVPWSVYEIFASS